MNVNKFLHDATGFVFWMPIGYGVVIVYLILIIIMLLFGSSKTKASWNLIYALCITAAFYLFMRYKFSDFIGTITGELDLSNTPIDVNRLPPQVRAHIVQKIKK